MMIGLKDEKQIIKVDVLSWSETRRRNSTNKTAVLEGGDGSQDVLFGSGRDTDLD